MLCMEIIPPLGILWVMRKCLELHEEGYHRYKNKHTAKYQLEKWIHKITIPFYSFFFKLLKSSSICSFRFINLSSSFLFRFRSGGDLTEAGFIFTSLKMTS